MKTLLDENMPEKLAAALMDAQHVNELGWQGLKNGALLQTASEAGFEILVTTDASIYNQQKA
jgi:predicted nuclease of predicted toxin-antitoxin system